MTTTAGALQKSGEFNMFAVKVFPISVLWRLRDLCLSLLWEQGELSFIHLSTFIPEVKIELYPSFEQLTFRALGSVCDFSKYNHMHPKGMLSPCVLCIFPGALWDFYNHIQPHYRMTSRVVSPFSEGLEWKSVARITGKHSRVVLMERIQSWFRAGMEIKRVT